MRRTGSGSTAGAGAACCTHPIRKQSPREEIYVQDDIGAETSGQRHEVRPHTRVLPELSTVLGSERSRWLR
jgi:hypothetical protein